MQGLGSYFADGGVWHRSNRSPKRRIEYYNRSDISPNLCGMPTHRYLGIASYELS